MNGLLHSFLRKPHDRTTSRRVSIILFALCALAWTSLAFGSEIHEAAGRGDVEEIQALLKSHPELINSKDENGDTPLHAAAAWTNRDVVSLLLAHKADVNARDNLGATPLHGAALQGRTDVVELLLANGADVNAKDKTGGTALRWAQTFETNKDVADCCWPTTPNTASMTRPHLDTWTSSRPF